MNTDIFFTDAFKLIDYLFSEKFYEIKTNEDTEYLFNVTQRELSKELNISLAKTNKIMGQLFEQKYIYTNESATKGRYYIDPKLIEFYIKINGVLKEAKGL